MGKGTLISLLSHSKHGLLISDLYVYQSEDLFLCRSVCPFPLAVFAHSLSLSFIWRDLTVSPVEKPPTHGASGSQLSKTPKLLMGLNRSPTQHHYLLQLHKCWFPTTATPHKLHTPICTHHSSTCVKHLQENVHTQCIVLDCVVASAILKYL